MLNRRGERGGRGGWLMGGCASNGGLSVGVVATVILEGACEY